MKIRDGLKIRDIAGEKVAVMQGRAGADMTRLLSFNATAEWLWGELSGRDFSAEDVAQLLAGKYGIDMQRAREDAGKWIESLLSCGAVEE